MCRNIFSLRDYITINISSPNTKGLRDFHKKEILKELLLKINDIRESSNFKKAFFLKISPDLKDENIDELIGLILEYKIDGVILTNTTDGNRENLLSKKNSKQEDLSGKPISDLSTKLIKRFYKDLKDRVPIIGVGGIDSGKDSL